jgi:serine/threonine-protein kinase
MGVVYRAWQEELGREVAVKVMKGGPNLPPHLTQSFIREARLLARLKHDHLVPVYEAKLHLGQPYFVMELIQGGSLADAVQRYADDPRGAAALVEVVARVVHYAHEQGVLHRDLKPANILLDEHGRPRVSDFGLAKLFGDDGELTANGASSADATGSWSASGAVKGTPPYMAPEQFRDPKAITRRTDVWALGVILYELLTGRRPFRGEGPLSYAQSVCESDPPPPRSVRPRLDRGLEAVVLKCLEKDPSRRYETAEEVANELTRWLRGLPPKALHESLLRRGWRQVRRSPLAATIGGLLTASLIACLAAGYLLDPARENKRIGEALAQGQSVEFIGANGPPVEYDWDEGKPYGHASTEKDRPFYVSTHSVALLRLWENPPPSYRLTAEIRHDSNPGNGQIGVYFDYRQPGPSVPWPCCYAIDFTDRGRNSTRFKNSAGQNGSHLRVMFLCFEPRPGLEPVETPQTVSENFFYLPPPLLGDEEIWRKIEISVSPHGLAVYWRNDSGAMECVENVGEHQFASCASSLPMSEPRMAGYTFNGTQRGACGLYICRSAASFRNVVLRPEASEP